MPVEITVGKEPDRCRPRSHRGRTHSCCALRIDYWAGSLTLFAKRSRQMFIDSLAMADGYKANHMCLAGDGVNDSKTADAILPQAAEFTLERLPAFGVGRNCANSRFDGMFQVWMERADHLSDMRRDIRTVEIHAVRRFLTGVYASPNTSSKERPFFPAL